MKLVVGAVMAIVVAPLLTVAAIVLAVPALALAINAPPPSAPTGSGAVADIPDAMLSLYISAAQRCPGLAWTVIAGIGKVETDHGRGGKVSPAGAEGPMQFMPDTWSRYGVDGDGDGVASIWDAPDAVPAAADYLCANGGGDPARLNIAIWNYNHDDAYVRLVLSWAATYDAAASRADVTGKVQDPPPQAQT